MNQERMFWIALGTGAAIGAGMLARRGAAAGWRYVRGEEPPLDAGDRDVRWQDLLAWAAVSGFCVAFARVIGRGVASGAWARALGRNPPK